MNLFGKTRARVVANDDPLKQGRVRVELPDLFADPSTGKVIPSPWCVGGGSAGAGLGTVDIPALGAVVWVQTRYSDDGEVYELTYERGPYGATEAGQSHLPATSRGVDDETVPLRASAPFSVPSPNNRVEVRKADGSVRLEAIDEKVTFEGIPPSVNAGEYPHNRVMKTVGGFTFEADDTPGKERLLIWHPNGTCVEVGSQGGWVQRQTAKWEETQDNDTSTVGGSWRRQVSGDVQVAAGRNYVEDTRSRRVISAGEINILARYNMLAEVRGAMQQIVYGRAGYEFVTDARFKSGGIMDLVGMFGAKIASVAGPAAMFSPVQVAISSGLVVNLTAPSINLEGATTHTGTVTNVGLTSCVSNPADAPTPVVRAPELIFLLNALGPFVRDPLSWATAVQAAEAKLVTTALVST